MHSLIDVKQRYVPDWVVLGDNSRMIFLSWLLAGQKLQIEENSVLWIQYGDKLTITRQEEQWIIETPMLLPGQTLCFPLENELGFFPETTRRTRYAVLEEFPFRKQDRIDLLQRLEAEGNETLVILMDLPRHQGSTDLIAPGKDLEQAVEAYRAEHYDVATMQSADDLQIILHWHRPMQDAWRKKGRKYLAELRERISDIPYDYPYYTEDYWMDDYPILQEKTMDQLFSYKTAMTEKGKNLWDCYAAASKRALFPTAGGDPFLPVMKLYQECLDNPLVFWSVAADLANFRDSLRSTFVKTLEKEEADGDYRKITKLPEPLNEDRYFQLVARSGRNGTALNAVFSRIIMDFLCEDVKDCMQERLWLRFQQLEDMIP